MHPFHLFYAVSHFTGLVQKAPLRQHTPQASSEDPQSAGRNDNRPQRQSAATTTGRQEPSVYVSM